MKRYGNLYEQIYDMDNLIKAHLHASQQKGWYNEIQEFNKNPMEWLRILQGMLINKTYETSEYEIFQRMDGVKIRTIYKLPYFPDRICQWAIMQVIEPILIKGFIDHTYSAIPGRGVHQCLNRLTNQIKADPEGTKYCLKLDVHHFYPSIDHDILKTKFRRVFKDPNLLWLLDEIIDSVPPKDGIPIGNYLSQYCSNFYLSAFDHWLKETPFTFEGGSARVRYNHRYMDDVIILHGSKQFLHHLIRLIEEYLRLIEEYLYTELRLTVKPNWQIFPIADRGIDFIGYVVFPDEVRLRKRNVNTMKSKIEVIDRKLMRGEELSYHDFCCINSYNGLIEPSTSDGLFKKYIQPLQPALQQYYDNNLKNSGKKGVILP